MKAANLCLALALVPAGVLSLGGCGSAPETNVAKVNLAEEGQQTLTEMERSNEGLKEFIGGGAGYAIFPSVGKGGLGVEVGSGHGSVYEGGKYIGTAQLSMLNVGAVIGGETYAELIVFKNKDALTQFEQNHTHFDATASVVALKAGAMANAKFTNGVAIFTRTNGGAEADASIGGQQFTFTAANIQATTTPTMPNP